MALKKEFIRELLELYPIREVQIEEMKLQIEELETGETLGSISFEERVQTSTICSNNDKNLYKIEKLKRTILHYERCNKRVDNLIKLITRDLQKDVIELVFFKKMNTNKAAVKLDRSRKQVQNLINQAINCMYEGSKITYI